MFYVRLLLSLVLVAVFASTGFAKPAGKTVGVSPVARIVKGSKKGRLAVGQSIFVGDRIATTTRGQVQIEFNDRTRLVIGPGSEMVISRYVASGRSRAKSFAIRAAAGAYRFISGRSRKSSYRITTPTGTIGIRGTRFDFGVRGAGRTYVMLYDGAVRLCGSAGGCRILDEFCELAGTNSRGQAALSNEPGFLPRRGDVRRSFPYVRSQRSLRRPFRVAGVSRCRDVVASPPGSDTNGGGGDRGGSGSNR